MVKQHYKTPGGQGGDCMGFKEERVFALRCYSNFSKAFCDSFRTPTLALSEKPEEKEHHVSDLQYYTMPRGVFKFNKSAK